MFFHLSAFTIILFLVLAGWYFYPLLYNRAPVQIQSMLPEPRLRTAGSSDYAFLRTFDDQRQAGLSSSLFDLSVNSNEEGNSESRIGLNEEASTESIHKLILIENPTD